MAKDKSTTLQECAECASSTTHKNVLYCKLMQQSDNIYNESARVSIKSCIWFKHKKG